MNEENHILAVIIGAIGSVQPPTAIQIELQPFVCTSAVIGLQIFAVWRCNSVVDLCSAITAGESQDVTNKSCSICLRGD